MSSYRSSYRTGYPLGYRVGGYATELGSITPLLWYDAQDIDLSRNSSFSDGGAVATWKNKGSMGAVADLTQATGAKQPIYRAVATSGKLNNKSAVESDGTMWMTSAVFATIAQPTIIVCVFRPTDLATAFNVVFEGISDHQSIFYAGTTGAISVYAGSVVAASQAVAATTWETTVTKFSGATSFNRLNGVQSAALNVGTSGLSAVRMFTDIGTGNTAKCMIAEYRLYAGALPDVLGLEADIAGKLGANPQ